MSEPIRGAGFQKRAEPNEAREVRIAVITTEGATATCSCGGWSTTHRRDKVREDRIDRHLAKRHDSRGLRL